MALYKNYKQQNTSKTKLPRASVVDDTTISNMMGYSGQGSVNMDHKDYGKIKSKGGLTKSNAVVNNYKSKKNKK